jgi:hypothetical protein
MPNQNRLRAPQNDLFVSVDRKRLFIGALPVRQQPSHSPYVCLLRLRRLFFYSHLILLCLCYIECLRQGLVYLLALNFYS